MRAHRALSFRHSLRAWSRPTSNKTTTLFRSFTKSIIIYVNRFNKTKPQNIGVQIYLKVMPQRYQYLANADRNNDLSSNGGGGCSINVISSKQCWTYIEASTASTNQTWDCLAHMLVQDNWWYMCTHARYLVPGGYLHVKRRKICLSYHLSTELILYFLCRVNCTIFSTEGWIKINWKHLLPLQ